ncbi:hypothetical protein V8E36_003293 [Tilletia maclaganii]
MSRGRDFLHIFPYSAFLFTLVVLQLSTPAMSDLIDLKLLARCAPSPHHSSDDVDDLIASSDLDPETVVPPRQDDSDEELDIEALKFSHPLLKMDDDFFVPHIENSPLSNDEVRNIVRQLCNYQRQDFMSLRSKLTFEERIDSFFGWATPILVMAGHQQPRKVLVSLAHHRKQHWQNFIILRLVL